MNLEQPIRPIIALGLMSGTSLDGIDAAMLETDGDTILDIGPSIATPYTTDFRTRLKAAVENAAASDQLVNDNELIAELTSIHTDCTRRLLADCPPDSKWSSPELIGFHGHTTLHRPDLRITQQIGDSKQLANEMRIPVVTDFRKQDIEAGGQGAPLAPIFHAAIMRSSKPPVAIVNIGGIANVTWIGGKDVDLVAFDTGPGNGLMDAWVERETGSRFDKDGELSASGQVNQKVFERLMENPYFTLRYPKSLDRSDFNLDKLDDLSPEDGAATLLAFTTATILLGLQQCPIPPETLYVTGGGRHNKTLMRKLSDDARCNVLPIEEENWNGDMIEAQAFAFMAVRTLKGLPITFNSTTGVARPLVGGHVTYPSG